MTKIKEQIILNTSEDRQIALEQYKMIVSSIEQLNNSREAANNFWVAANSIAITSFSYINNISDLTSINKNTLSGVILLIGYLICLSWISYLNTIRRSLNVRYEILIKAEKFFPIKAFQQAYGQINKKEGNKSLSFKELLVPCIFLGAYTFLMLVFFVGGDFWC